MKQWDKRDWQILRLLQSDALLSTGELAERCALSKTAVWRRIKSLEEQGILGKRIALLDARKLGFKLTVFALVRTNQHSDEWFRRFSQAVTETPEIVEFYRTSGEIDYLLRVVVKDIEDYDRVYKQLIKRVDFADISSTFVMEMLKAEPRVPI